MTLTPIRELVKKTKQISPTILGRDTFKYIDISSVDKDTKTITTPQDLYVEDAPSRARKEIKERDVLVATVRPNLNGVAIVPHIYDGEIASTGFCVLRADEIKLDPNYLFYFTQSDTFISHLTKLSIGAGYPAVSDGDILDTKISFLPLPEQKRIAERLAKADRLRQLRRYASQLGESYLQSVFLEMFGNPATNPMGWETVQLGDKLDFMTSGSRGWAKYYAEKGDLFLRVQNLGANRLLLDDVAYVQAPDSSESRRTKVKTGDLLFSATADLGRTGVVPENLPTAYINQHLFILRFTKDLNPYFVAGYFSTQNGKAQVLRLDREGVKSGLNFDDVKSLGVFYPPLAEQERFTEIVVRYEGLRSQARESARQGEGLFQSLLAEAFHKSSS